MCINNRETITIDRLKGKSLVSLKNELTNAINGKIPIKININSNEPEEILKGTYIAQILDKRGYICSAKFQNNEMNWYCKHSQS